MADNTPDKRVHAFLNHLLAATAKYGANVLKRLGAVLADALGVARKRKPAPAMATDTGTRLAEERTDMALLRTYWASDRTLMAWVRTSLSMISFGFTIGKLGQAMQVVEIKGLRGSQSVSVDTIALFLVMLGTVALLVSSVQYAIRIHALCNQGLCPQVNLSFVVSVLLTLLGMCAFTSLVSGL